MEEFSTNPPKRRGRLLKNVYVKPVAVTLGAVLVVVLSFVAGAQFERHHSGKAAKPLSGRFGQGVEQPSAGGRMRHMGTLGTVTAVSASSITIQNSRIGGNTTYTINSATKITKDGVTASVGDIQTGATVVIQASGSDVAAASEIEINPSMDGTTSQLPDMPSTNVN
ncbi:MAG TPA: hypothetical protein VJR27_05510 [Candidatus Saccharimonadales bacterium]|nr:hypothetical protein [Candidatus Saccharimonadales bacterium]